VGVDIGRQREREARGVGRRVETVAVGGVYAPMGADGGGL